VGTEHRACLKNLFQRPRFGSGRERLAAFIGRAFLPLARGNSDQYASRLFCICLLEHFEP
jgi:hypothetical protein